jgi:hypothetical protein
MECKMKTVKQIEHLYSVKSSALSNKINYFSGRVSSISDVSTTPGKRAMTLAKKCLKRSEREFAALTAKYKLERSLVAAMGSK